MPPGPYGPRCLFSPCTKFRILQTLLVLLRFLRVPLSATPIFCSQKILLSLEFFMKHRFTVYRPRREGCSFPLESGFPMTKFLPEANSSAGEKAFCFLTTRIYPPPLRGPLVITPFLLRASGLLMSVFRHSTLTYTLLLEFFLTSIPLGCVFTSLDRTAHPPPTILCEI